ncbi:hypothetical protein F5Y03DRAFT_15923 [Xylaria venustula]|nr:hypothetical protein F5Y03DRAFT_15923 [Xylaria venustula]
MMSSQGAGLIAVSIIFLVAAIVSAIFRFRARHISSLNWFVDDYMVIVALLSLFSYAIIDILGVAKYKLGTPVIFIAPIDYAEILKLEYGHSLVMIILSTFARLSIAYFYRRILPPYRKSKSSLILLVLVYAWGIAYMAAALFSCIPISKRWDLADGGACVSTIQQSEAFDISSLAINVILLCRPLTQVREFRYLYPRMKASISGIVVLGLLVIVIMITRTAITYTGESVESPYNLPKLDILAEVEAGLLVTCACLLTLVSSRPIGDLEKTRETERYEKPELAAEHVPRPYHELDSTTFTELPVPTPELVGTEQRHEAENTSIVREYYSQPSVGAQKTCELN